MSRILKISSDDFDVLSKLLSVINYTNLMKIIKIRKFCVMHECAVIQMDIIIIVITIQPSESSECIFEYTSTDHKHEKNKKINSTFVAQMKSLNFLYYFRKENSGDFIAFF